MTKLSTGVSHVENYQYNYTSGELTQSQDENSQITTYAYNDPLLRLTDTYGPPSPGNNGSKAHAKIAYVDGAGSSVTTTDPVGVSAKKLYDGMGHVTQNQLVSDPNIVYADIKYNGMGQVYSSTNPYRTGDAIATTVFAYDGVGRKTLQIQPDNVTTTSLINGVSQTSYSSAQQWLYSGNQTTFIDEGGHPWVRTWDALGRLINVSEPNRSSTGYIYNALNNLTSATQSGVSGESARTRSFYYDSLSQLITATNPETGPICYGQRINGECVNGYDGNGNLVAKTDARGVVTSYNYDALNRLTSKSYSDGTPTAAFGYDGKDENGVALTTPSLNSVGRLSRSVNTNLGSNYSYDEMGRVKQQSYCFFNCGQPVSVVRVMTWRGT